MKDILIGSIIVSLSFFTATNFSSITFNHTLMGNFIKKATNNNSSNKHEKTTGLLYFRSFVLHLNLKQKHNYPYFDRDFMKNFLEDLAKARTTSAYASNSHDLRSMLKIAASIFSIVILVERKNYCKFSILIGDCNSLCVPIDHPLQNHFRSGKAIKWSNFR
ncbi:hypothetical protein BpHYR1_007417 [Brachionus plicatilis]|uniref:Uncharacterized protein n=1 Tax=Brachionus plicatilis TaxID=10195 RepID=A0A3M7SMC7_BRAPC|nr:hypothetical protein BpHYR1_007417 [Brachionus plicatilis]